MREIKFRIWNRKAKQIQYPTPPWSANEGDLKEIYFDWNIWDADKLQQDLMQFTGLKDKNEKEIFEGDIVKRINAGYIYTVEYSLEYAAYILRDLDNDIVFLSDFNNIEVIGNIFENSELLKHESN